MTIVAICIEPGAVETGFAKELANRLNLRLCDLRRFEADIAERSDFGDGKLHSLVHHRSRRLRNWCVEGTELAARIREEVLQHVIEGDALIVGWSAIPVLRNFEHVAKVMVRAPLRFRHFAAMRQLAYRELGTAELEIDSADALIDRFVQRLFATDWRDPANYDVVLDADRIPATLQVDLVKVLAASDRFQEAPGVRARVEAALEMLRLHESWSADQEAAGANQVTVAAGSSGGPGRYLQ